MSEAVAKNKKEKSNDKAAEPIGKIGSLKPELVTTPDKELAEKYAELEKSLLSAVRTLLKEHGVRKSGAAIRDAVEIPHEKFAPQQAVSALSTLGFKSSFGSFKIKNLSASRIIPSSVVIVPLFKPLNIFPLSVISISFTLKLNSSILLAAELQKSIKTIIVNLKKLFIIYLINHNRINHKNNQKRNKN